MAPVNKRLPRLRDLERAALGYHSRTEVADVVATHAAIVIGAHTAANNVCQDQCVRLKLR